MKKEWIKIKCGLLDIQHREKIGVKVWLFMYIIDRVDWETGVIEDWRDKEAAEDFGMPWRTLQDQRQQLSVDGYITCEPTFQGQRIIVHKWTNPREYSGKVYNERVVVPEKVYGNPSTPGTEILSPIRTESSVPLLLDSHLDSHAISHLNHSASPNSLTARAKFSEGVVVPALIRSSIDEQAKNRLAEFEFIQSQGKTPTVGLSAEPVVEEELEEGDFDWKAYLGVDKVLSFEEETTRGSSSNEPVYVDNPFGDQPKKHKDALKPASYFQAVILGFMGRAKFMVGQKAQLKELERQIEKGEVLKEWVLHNISLYNTRGHERKWFPSALVNMDRYKDWKAKSPFAYEYEPQESFPEHF